MTIFTADVTGLQTSHKNGTFDPSVATLTLFQHRTTAKRILQDTTDATALSGIATFSGFWTFFNGVFVMFFGGSVIYFMFGKLLKKIIYVHQIKSFIGRRPLTALGLVHSFQRCQLVRQWHEDFPAIHTEGGLPGSTSAGIIAFIRERLVDLGDDPCKTEDDDIEAQMLKFEEAAEPDKPASVSNPVAQNDRPGKTYSKVDPLKPGYILDEIPLIDVDLGMRDILDTKSH
jgi:hypothetical protein